jgi:hypothetical protein
MSRAILHGPYRGVQMSGSLTPVEKRAVDEVGCASAEEYRG